MDIESFLKLLFVNSDKVPKYCGIYFDTRTNYISLVEYIYYDKEYKNIILTDNKYTDYEEDTRFILLKGE